MNEWVRKERMENHLLVEHQAQIIHTKQNKKKKVNKFNYIYPKIVALCPVVVSKNDQFSMNASEHEWMNKSK